MKLTQTQREMLQKHRQAQGYTPESLSPIVEIAAQTIRNIEAGAGHPRKVRKLVDALGIPVEQFYGLED